MLAMALPSRGIEEEHPRHWERERNRDGVEWRSSWGREEGKGEVIAAERN